MERKEKILVVEDSAPNRLLLRTLLENEGYAIDEVVDGQQCLDYCQKQLPDMILLDVMMPGISGLDVCSKLRQLHSNVELPIVMVTTLSDGSDIAKGLHCGANDYILKPIDRDVLLARIKTHLTFVIAQRELIRQKRIIEHALQVQNYIGDALPEAVILHDQNGRLAYVNAEVRRACGGRSLVDIEEVFRTAYDGCFAEALMQKYLQLKEDSSKACDTSLEARMAGRTIRVLSRPVPFADGDFQRLWVWRDETEMRELERRASQRVKLDTVALFAAGIAHNFNNIMGGVLGAAEILGRLSKDNERGMRCVSVIKRGVDAGMRLTRKMGAIHRRQGQFEASASYLPALLESILAGYRQLVSDRIEIVVSLPAVLPPIAIKDHQLLEILGSLVTNAIESIDGVGEVTVSGKLDATGRFLDLTVVDTGCGMDDEVKSHLYEPFFSTKRVDKMSGVSVEGRGLGLWNTYNLLRMHQGDLHIESEAGKGTTVWIKLPCCSPQTDAPSALP